MMADVAWQTPRASGQVALLRAVHDHPGCTRVVVARQVGMPSGFAAETIARLAGRDLLAEQPVPPTGTRGRPTTSLHPHPDGPLVAVAAIAHETWTVATVQLGGTPVEAVSRAHRRDEAAVLAEVAAALEAVRLRYGARIRAVAVAVPGTVSGTILAQAPNLGWHDVDLSDLWPRQDPDIPFVPGNDATVAGVAEWRRGAAIGAGTAIHLYMDAGIGGAIGQDGRVVPGATGMAGEFGHMPFGDPSERCRCGAMGCWNTSLDGLALARALHQPVPVDEVSYTRRIIGAARDGQPEALEAVRSVARSFGHGAAGLVNAFDPDVVTVGGVGRELLSVAGDDVTRAYGEGLMQFRASPPPRLTPGRFGDDAPLVGAAEAAFSVVLTDDGLRAWSSRENSR